MRHAQKKSQRKQRKQKSQSQSQSQRKQKNQHGGAGDGMYGYTAPAFMAGDVPYSNRVAFSQCGWDARPPPSQNGGGCPCGAPSFVGGGSVGIGSNELGKVWNSYNVAGCGPAPMANPLRGGAAVDDQGIVSYKTGYGYEPSSVYSSHSAHYIHPLQYERHCSGGARKTHKRQSRS